MTQKPLKLPSEVILAATDICHQRAAELRKHAPEANELVAQVVESIARAIGEIPIERPFPEGDLVAHARFQQDRVINYSECRIDHYNSNNGVTLKDHRDNVLFYIDGSVFNIRTDTPRLDVIHRTDSLFRALLVLRNQAYERGIEIGILQQQDAIRKALGV